MLNIRHLVGAILLLHNGLTKILAESKDFYELEKGISKLSQKVSSQMLIWTLEQLDLNLMNNRDRETWEVIGFKEKQTYAKTGDIWAINRVEEINIGGDGEKGVKQGLEYFPGARYRLDPYHLSKNLIEK
ncbi:hypothetical protein AN618_18200 [Fervidicola ferrireducens]|uniref:Uncharacterized protein n=1 Tax=Fervidicola ferrireducens TaxID=520764 RepID=A0A140L4R7_9FIRM|nr:hypothetical protein AN618_18200 [Fervidicola ferrireducens]